MKIFQLFANIKCYLAFTNPLHWSPYKAKPGIYRHKSHDSSGQMRSFDKANLDEPELPAPWTWQSLNKYIREEYTGVENYLASTGFILNGLNTHLLYFQFSVIQTYFL